MRPPHEQARRAGVCLAGRPRSSPSVFGSHAGLSEGPQLVHPKAEFLRRDLPTCLSPSHCAQRAGARRRWLQPLTPIWLLISTLCLVRRAHGDVCEHSRQFLCAARVAGEVGESGSCCPLRAGARGPPGCGRPPGRADQPCPVCRGPACSRYFSQLAVEVQMRRRSSLQSTGGSGAAPVGGASIRGTGERGGRAQPCPRPGGRLRSRLARLS